MAQPIRAMAILLLAGGATTGAGAAGDRSGAAALADPSTGEPVKKICLVSELSDWADLGESAVLVRRGPQEYSRHARRGVPAGLGAQPNCNRLAIGLALPSAR